MGSNNPLRLCDAVSYGPLQTGFELTPMIGPDADWLSRVLGDGMGGSPSAMFGRSMDTDGMPGQTSSGRSEDPRLGFVAYTILNAQRDVVERSELQGLTIVRDIGDMGTRDESGGSNFVFPLNDLFPNLGECRLALTDCLGIECKPSVRDGESGFGSSKCGFGGAVDTDYASYYAIMFAMSFVSPGIEMVELHCGEGGVEKHVVFALSDKGDGGVINEDTNIPLVAIALFRYEACLCCRSVLGTSRYTCDACENRFGVSPWYCSYECKKSDLKRHGAECGKSVLNGNPSLNREFCLGRVVLPLCSNKKYCMDTVLDTYEDRANAVCEAAMAKALSLTFGVPCTNPQRCFLFLEGSNALFLNRLWPFVTGGKLVSMEYGDGYLSAVVETYHMGRALFYFGVVNGGRRLKMGYSVGDGLYISDMLGWKNSSSVVVGTFTTSNQCIICARIGPSAESMGYCARCSVSDCGAVSVYCSKECYGRAFSENRHGVVCGRPGNYFWR